MAASLVRFSSLILALCMTCGGCLWAQTGAVMDLASFPRSTLTIQTGDRSSGRQPQLFDVWVADSPARRSQGLMFVRDLPKDSGMLFLFGEPQPVSMWMKNTFISLDMLFIAADGRIIRIAERTEPQSLRTIESGGEATAVLEIAGGECARRKIRVGDSVQHPAFAAPRPVR